ncbi:RND transporter [Halobacteriales archaeon QS_1_68_20]|nr:MAG: RND transporter [Halobacteriales archaeon QS_1_68_20]
MSRDPIGAFVGFVTRHNRIVLVVMLLLTAGVVSGIGQLQLESDVEGDSDAFGDTTVAQKADYVAEHYGEDDDASSTVTSAVYVRDEGGNVLSKDALLAALRYQQSVLDDPTAADALAGADGVRGVPNLVARRAAGDPDADLAAQVDALASLNESEVRALVSETLTADSEALDLLPSDYEPGTATAESMRMEFAFEATGDDATGGTPADVQRVLYETANERDDPDFFTTGQHARQPFVQQSNQDTIWLILPPALLLILAVLAFAYRDVVDVVVGFVGVLVSVLWMFGILGWLRIPAGMTLIVGPVLITGLSIDYGLHVFMRYREERGPDEGIREPMRRSTTSVAVAFLLVTVTAAVGFLANLANPLNIVRDLGVGITLGVVSAFVVFVTLVPALKISVDGLLERIGLDRRKAPLGEGAVLRPFLRSGVVLARKAAPAVVLVTVLLAAAGAVTYADVDRQAYQTSTEVAEWKEDLPGPMAWEATDTEYYRNSQYVQQHYRSGDDRRGITQVLVQGDVTDPATFQHLQDGIAAAEESRAVFEQGGVVPVRSPISVIRSVAATDEEFAAVVRETDEDGDTVPDRDLERVYDALFETAPDRAATVIERTDGEYRSVRMLVPVKQGLDVDVRGEEMRAVAAAVEGDGPLTATAVGPATIQNAELGQLADGIVKTMVLALGVILVVLTIIYRVTEGSALLGALTVVPIALVLGFVLGGMYLTDTPITFVTALLISLAVGLGIDYNIHVSDRFAQELDGGKAPVDALSTAVVGTGGALLGSALTSGGAFATLLLHPSPQLRGFGMLVVLALSLSFLVSVFVLPSLLVLWAQYAYDGPVEAESEGSDTAAVGS